MAVTLVESAKLSTNDLQRGVIETFIQASPILDRIPFLGIQGNAYAYNEEGALPGVAFRAVNEIILLDEIFAVGDAAFQDKCKRRCRELKAAGHTILLVSHSPYIAEFCDRAILIEGGRIVRTDVARHVIDAYHQRIGHG